MEYFAVRNSTGVFDLSPMTKYRISGSDSGAFINKLITRDIRKLAVGRVSYVLWCDGEGKVMDDGTIFRLSENDYRLCCYTRALDWLMWTAEGFDVTICEETAEVAALAVQGPTSCAVLKAMGFSGIELLKPFGMAYFNFSGSQLMVSRTGFTGDLGYEVWMEPNLGEIFWDALFAGWRGFCSGRRSHQEWSFALSFRTGIGMVGFV